MEECRTGQASVQVADTMILDSYSNVRTNRLFVLILLLRFKDNTLRGVTGKICGAPFPFSRHRKNKTENSTHFLAGLNSQWQPSNYPIVCAKTVIFERF